MKIGDWVRNKDDEIFQLEDLHMWQKDLDSLVKLWKPKEGEWCWSKYDGLVQILKITDERYFVFPLSTYLLDCTIEYRLGGLEPFIGELPSFIKDKQWK